LNCVAVLLAAFLPEAAGKIRAAIGKPDEATTLDDARWGAVAPGTRVVKLGGLFPRVEVKAGDSVSMGKAVGGEASAPKVSMDEFVREIS
jgi:methionyl-tRNA synthetase